jgi:hypothetical protein
MLGASARFEDAVSAGAPTSVARHNLTVSPRVAVVVVVRIFLAEDTKEKDRGLFFLFFLFFACL